MATMTENEGGRKTLVWIVDSGKDTLQGSRGAVEPCGDIAYFAGAGDLPSVSLSSGSLPSGSLSSAPLSSDSSSLLSSSFPDVVLVSAEIEGGAGGEAFQRVRERAAGVPVIVLARLRSLAQAVAFFRAGAVDYLSLPLDPEDVRERILAALERADALMLRNAVRGVVIEVEPVEGEPAPGEVSLRIAAPEASDDEDILARLDPAPASEVAEPSPASSEHSGSSNDDPVPVDGLPIPSLWEELPCGVLVFDSNGNLVFSNAFALELFGFDSLASLQEALEENRAGFLAHGANHAPLPDNQWPHVAAAKTRIARSAVISIMRPDRRRCWFRVDCLPHVHDGQMNRLSMTIVNLTGELPPLALAPPVDSDADIRGKNPKPSKASKAKRRGKKRHPAPCPGS